MKIIEKQQLLQQQIIQQRTYTQKRDELKDKLPSLKHEVFRADFELHEAKRLLQQLQKNGVKKAVCIITGRYRKETARLQRSLRLAQEVYDKLLEQEKETESLLEEANADLQELRGCEEKYKQLLQYCQDKMRNDAGEPEKLVQAENNLRETEKNLEENKEILILAKRALAITDSILQQLDSAESWGKIDLLGGGIIATSTKHTYMDQAQDRIEQLNILLGQLQQKLNHTAYIMTGTSVTAQGFERFADYFFDGIGIDYMTLNKIHISQSQIQTIANSLKNVIQKLETWQEDASLNILGYKAEIETMVWAYIGKMEE